MDETSPPDHSHPETGKPTKSQETRQSLVDAAIHCLNEFGYSATTMRRVADTAGVTQGPRQYYFPATTDLFAAVVDEIHRLSATDYSSIRHDKPALAERVVEMVRHGCEHCGSPQHMAMLELKLALRGDPVLREAIGERIDAYETKADDNWVEMFKSSGLSRERVVSLRNILAAALRGLGLAMASDAQLPPMKEAERILVDIVMRELEVDEH